MIVFSVIAVSSFRWRALGDVSLTDSCKHASTKYYHFYELAKGFIFLLSSVTLKHRKAVRYSIDIIGLDFSTNRPLSTKKWLSGLIFEKFNLRQCLS